MSHSTLKGSSPDEERGLLESKAAEGILVYAGLGAGKDGERTKTPQSSISSNEITSDNSDIEFWVREYEREENTRYHEVPRFEKEPETTYRWWKDNSAMVVEYICLIIVSAIGVVALIVGWINESLESTLTLGSLVAAIFLNAFVISLYTFIMQIVCLRYGQKHDDRTLNRRTLRKRLLLQAVPFAAYLGIVALSCHNMLKQGLSWGKALISAGLVEWSRRLLFFVPRPADRIRSLEEELVTVKNSIAISLADAYFYNFLEWVLKDIAKYTKANKPVRIIYVDINGEPFLKDKDGSTQKSMKTAAIGMTLPFFFVVVPRRIHWDENAPIRNVIDDILESASVANCQIESSRTRRSIPADQDNKRDKKKFRPQTIMVDEDSASKTTTLFDVPTTLSVVTRIIRENKELLGEDEELTNKQRDEEYLKEINRFTWRLQWRLYKANLENMVCTVELENGLEAESNTLAQNKSDLDSENKLVSEQKEDLFYDADSSLPADTKEGAELEAHSKLNATNALADEPEGESGFLTLFRQFVGDRSQIAVASSTAASSTSNSCSTSSAA